MTQLEREVVVDGKPMSVEALHDLRLGHMNMPVRDIVAERKGPAPDRAALVRAAAWLQGGSPAVVGKLAAWMDLLDELASLGLDDLARAQVVLELLESDRPGGRIPGPDVVSWVARTLDRDQVGLLAARPGFPPRGDLLTALALGVPVDDVPPETRIERLPPQVQRRILQSLSDEARERILLARNAAEDRTAAWHRVQWFVHLEDLFDRPRLVQARAATWLLAGSGPLLDALRAELDAGGLRTDPEGLGVLGRDVVGYWEDLRTQALARGAVGPLAEHACSYTVDLWGCPELADADAWQAAGATRREAAVGTLLDLLGKPWKAVRSELALPVLAHRKRRFVLVPGGTVQVGLSAVQEAKLRAAAEQAGLAGSHEEWGALLEQLDHMRPVRNVHVGPLLAARQAEACDPGKVTRWLAKGPWRLPTESEWEHLCRGGQADKLTWRGDALPLGDWLVESRNLGADAPHNFGLWGFGDLPELCADVWTPDHHALPQDGGPVRGDGPRVVRGGAGLLHPWQGCGEWHLLLAAMRTSAQSWDHSVGLRPVLGIRLCEQAR